MQPRELNNQLVRYHYIVALEGTNNLVFAWATIAPSNDRKYSVTDQLREAFGWGDEIKTLFDYRNRVEGIYDRLYELCIISLCSDIEFFFKQLFTALQFESENGKGFFQRFDDVIESLNSQGMDLSAVSDDCKVLSEAFQFRHLCTHNFGIVDEKFEQKFPGFMVGQKIVLGANEYRRFFDAYPRFLKEVDNQLTAKF